MPLKNVFLLAGTVMLIVGCSNGITSPTSIRAGGSAASAKAPPTAPTSTPSGTATSTEECRSGYVFSGRGDSVCMDGQ